jgi:glucan phosphoethanolaminetransferase (alkaline phosphatase superfamily)
MVARAIMIPVQVWSDPLWAQFVADTLPEMTFASAWTLLVSFFVQLVGVALGSGTSASPGVVIQITAYVVYAIVIGAYFWNPVASVLLYALLCCIYAALFGTTLYFCPRLLTLLQPSLVRHSGLAIRLVACSILCVFVFGGRTFGLARKVVAPPRTVSWWWQYGALELIPAILFLLMMHPNTNRMSVASQSATPPTNKDTLPSHRRHDSHGSRRLGESAPLVKPASVSVYGSTNTAG